MWGFWQFSQTCPSTSSSSSITMFLASRSDCLADKQSQILKTLMTLHQFSCFELLILKGSRSLDLQKELSHDRPLIGLSSSIFDESISEVWIDVGLRRYCSCMHIEKIHRPNLSSWWASKELTNHWSKVADDANEDMLILLTKPMMKNNWLKKDMAGNAKQSCKIVYIPADPHEEICEQQIEYTEANEVSCVQDHAKVSVTFSYELGESQAHILLFSGMLMHRTTSFTRRVSYQVDWDEENARVNAKWMMLILS